MAFLTSLRQRRCQPEMMDDPQLDPARHVQALACLARINSLSGSARILWGGLVALARDNRRLLVTTNVDSVFVIDLDSLTVRGVVGLPGAGATIAFDPPGTRAYVSVPDAGVVSELDMTRLHEVRRFAVGRRPVGMAVSPDARELYIADEREHVLKIWDLKVGTPLAVVTLGGPAWDLQITPDSTQLNVGLLGGAIQIVDRAGDGPRDGDSHDNRSELNDQEQERQSDREEHQIGAPIQSDGPQDSRWPCPND